MIEFIQAVFDPDNRFLTYALAMGGLSAVAFGIIGTFVTIKRIGYLAGAISHSILGGVGLALYLQSAMGLKWADPVLGAVVAAVSAALIIGMVSIKAKEREDTIIGTLWAVGMAAGILFLDKAPGYFNLTSYLFGDILLISGRDLAYVVCLDLIILAASLLFFNRFFGICFDEEFTLLRGINTTAYYLLLLILTALTVVLMVRIVGIVLVIALLTIPPAIAGFYSRRLWQMMAGAVILCILFTWTGLGISYYFSLSSGPVIIVFSGLVYVTLLIVNLLIRKA